MSNLWQVGCIRVVLFGVVLVARTLVAAALETHHGLFLLRLVLKKQISIGGFQVRGLWQGRQQPRNEKINAKREPA